MSAHLTLFFLNKCCAHTVDVMISNAIFLLINMCILCLDMYVAASVVVVAATAVIAALYSLGF